MSNTTKVLVCSPMGLVGGISKWTQYIKDHFEATPQNCAEVSFLDMSNKKYLGENAPILARLRNGIGAYLRFLKVFKKEIRESRPDVVHICSSASLGLVRDYLMMKACKSRRIKTTIHLHFGRLPEVMSRGSWEKKLLVKVIGNASQIVVMDRRSESALTDLGYRHVNFVPNPLAPQVKKLADSDNTDFNPKHLVFAGHLLDTKGINELFEAVKGNPGVTLTLMGKDVQGLWENFKDENPEIIKSNRVVYLGEVDHKTVLSEIKKGIFVLPSYTEGFPNVILESMACGVPSIATDVGAIAEMLDVDSGTPCGLIIPKQNSVKLSEAIQNLSNDLERCKKLGNNAKARVNTEYSIDKVSTSLTEIWEHP